MEIETPGQSTGHRYNIRDLKGRFEDANAGTDKTVTIDSSEAVIETGASGVNLQNYRISSSDRNDPSDTGFGFNRPESMDRRKNLWR